MSIMDYLDKTFNNQIKDLSEKEQKMFNGYKNALFSIYRFVKPFMIAVALFWIFSRIRQRLDPFQWFEEMVFIQLTIIIIFLRNISSKIK